MVILDITAVNIALPSLAGDLHLTGSDISWTITGYSLVFGRLLLLSGRAADLHRAPADVPHAASSIFAVVVRLSDRPHRPDAFFAARAGQGSGQRCSLLRRSRSSCPPSREASGRRLLAAWGAVGGAGAADRRARRWASDELADWRMIFYVDLPIAAALAIARSGSVPAGHPELAGRGLDLRGALLATTSLGAVVFTITPAQGAGWTSCPDARLVGLGRSARTRRFAAPRAPHGTRTAVNRLADRAVGDGVFLMLAATGSISASSCSARSTSRTCSAGAALHRPRLHPARARGRSRRARVGHIVSKHGVRGPLAGASWSRRPG